MPPDNTRLARRWFEEVWNLRREATAHELLAPDAVCHSEGGELRGADGFLTHLYRPFVSDFPDFRVTVEATVAEGAEVVVRWTASGTHAPTGRKVRFRGITWIHYRDGKMLEGWDCFNQTGLVEAIRTGKSLPSVSLE